MTELPLSNSSKKALVDDEDFIRCLSTIWSLAVSRNNNYKVRGSIGSNIVNLSNFVMNKYHIIYDHIDRNSLNNQKLNLREADRSQNQINRAKWNINSTSKYKGVSKRNRNRPWQAAINIYNCNKYLGSFYTEIEAAKAYDKAAKKFYGEFAVLNFPVSKGRS